MLWECLGIEPHAGPRSLLAQALTVFQRSLTSMQIQVAGLLQFAVPLFPTAEVRQPLPTGQDVRDQAVERESLPSLGSLAPSFGFKGLFAQLLLAHFIHKPSPSQRSFSASLSACLRLSSCFRKICLESSSC